MKKLLIVAAALMVGACVSARAADVQENWNKCAKCHGEDGKGQTKMGQKLGIRDYSDAKVQAALTDDQIAKAIKEGVKEGDKTKMKGYSDLSAEEVKALVAYVRAFKK